MIGIHYIIVSAESGYHHQQRGIGEMEIRNESGGDGEIVGREYEFVRPSRKSGEFSFCRDTGFQSSAYGSAYGTYAFFLVFGFIHDFYRFLRDYDFFGVHFMFCKVFYIHGSEVAQAYMQCDERFFDSFYLHAFQ